MITVTQTRIALELLERQGLGDVPMLRVQGGLLVPMNPPALFDRIAPEFDTSLAPGVTRFVTMGS